MKTLKEKIAVMQAALEGKAIQCRLDSGTDLPWRTSDCVPDLSWNWDVFDYRIAPKPTKKRVPLTMEDLVGRCVCFKGKKDTDIFFPSWITKGGIGIAFRHSTDLATYELVADAYEISYDWGKSWGPCWRETEGES